MGNELCDRESSLVFPDLIIFAIFSHLNRKDLISSSEVCQQWWRVSKFEILWKKLFLSDFKLDQITTLAPCCSTNSWYSEYRRISDEIPVILSQVLTTHSDEVLHVAFSHNGSMFSTCSKDCTIKIWTSEHPCQLIHQKNFRKFNWNYTQFSQFNVDDRLLLVSGVRNETITGEIAVFEVTVDKLSLRYRVSNRPYDIFGCWFNASVLLNGDIHYLRNFTSCSLIQMFGSPSDLHTTQKPSNAKLFKFMNYNSSSIRMVLVSNFVSDWVRQAVEVLNKTKISYEHEEGSEGKNFRGAINQVIATASAQDQHREEDIASNRTDSNHLSSSCISKSANINSKLDNVDPRLVIFGKGADTYTPHIICFKLVKQERVDERFIEEVTSSSGLKKVQNGINNLKRRIMKTFTGVEHVRPLETSNDFPDHWIDMRGHIIGIALSTDERYLYVNVRSWSEDAEVINHWQPPAISVGMEIRVIDMRTLALLSTSYHGHKGYSPSNECFFIFLDSCEAYIARKVSTFVSYSSGSEDKFAYIWDRHYDLQQQLPHDGAVNAVSFNPKSNELLVSASDDHKIKIWRSKKMLRELDIKIDK